MPSSLSSFAQTLTLFLAATLSYPAPTEAKGKIDAESIPKYSEHLLIPPVLHDVQVNNNVEIAMRQITQQVLPSGFPETTLWAYGNPNEPTSFSHPSGTIENIENEAMTVTWIKELVQDPDQCRQNPESDACNYLKHVIQDKYGVPIIDQTLHWAAPNKQCLNGKNQSDCQGNTIEPYTGPIPITTHVHGARHAWKSDGYPESWFLPAANNIPDGYATEGTYYTSYTDPLGNETNATLPSGGYAVYKYDNAEANANLWYHDHTLGITRLNVYAAGAGFWLIRAKNESGTFVGTDCGGMDQALPGPPPLSGEDPNGDLSVRSKIREIPLAIQPMTFYDDGSLFYPANRLYYYANQCGGGRVFANTHGVDVPFLPDPNSDISPVWLPETYFETMVVNGKTWPKLEVAPERYRFRLLNAADSNFLNLALFTQDGEELPFYVIGSDQGFLPNVVKIRTGYYTKIIPCDNESSVEEMQTSMVQALLMGPGERYDVIVDFTGIPNGTEIIMRNTAPDGPFMQFDTMGGMSDGMQNMNGTDGNETQSMDGMQGMGGMRRVQSMDGMQDMDGMQSMNGMFENGTQDMEGMGGNGTQDMDGMGGNGTQNMQGMSGNGTQNMQGTGGMSYTPANNQTTGQVMKFIIKEELMNPDGDMSTPPSELMLRHSEPLPNATMIRDLAVLEDQSHICSNGTGCDVFETSCDGGNSFGLIRALLGYDGSKGASGAVGSLWMDPIFINPSVDDVEIWELWNWSMHAHTIHLHMVPFEIVGRYSMMNPDMTVFPTCPWEAGLKDIVVVLPGQVTKIKMRFDRPGLSVWHCHLLSHEDNQMMLPYCVGEMGVDCPM